MSYHPGTHALYQAGDWTYSTPDDSGNQTVRENISPTEGFTQEITYTGFNLPRTIATTDDTGPLGSMAFAYDADRQRVKETSPEGTRLHVGELYTRWSPASGPKEHRYAVYAGTRRIADVTRVEDVSVLGPQNVSYFHADLLGSTDAITPETLATQADVQRQEYSVFGELGAGTAVQGTQHVGFTGHQHDIALGLINMRGRMYDPVTSRFMSPDPIVHNETWSQAWNRYSYALNNPLKYVDPTGFDFWDDIGSAFETLVVGAVGALRGGLVGMGIAYLIAGVACGATAGAACVAGALFIGAYFGGVVGGLSGLVTGGRGIYDWSDPQGYATFIADNTYGAFGTTLGDILNLANLIKYEAAYDEKSSRHQNRQVYFNGFRLDPGSAFTQGNVISMKDTSAPGSEPYERLLAHETEHIMQNRGAGIIMQASYVATISVGIVAATADLLTGPGWENVSWDRYWGILKTVGYNDNPFEVFAYAMHNPRSYCAPDPAWGVLKQGPCGGATIGD